jgi:predicted Ser/Thr protein kinase
MGAVYKARQRSLDRFVALKILAVDPEDDPSFAERFAREARALAALDHPSVVRVYDSGRAGGRWYFVMEYVDGTDLRRMLRAGRVEPREALAIVAQVCDALQYAHDQGVVHRDIKPENILVDRQGRVKIADFGLAKIVGRAGDAFALTGSHQAMGTPHYMAPEQIEHPQTVDHRADIYSLGVVLYELLTGELPLGRFVPPSRKVEVDVRLDEVVLKALEKEPPRRYQHASEVKTSIEDLERPGGRAKRPARGTPEHARHVTRGLGLLFLALLLVGVVLTAAQLVWGSADWSSAATGVLLFGPWLLLTAVAGVLYLVARSRARASGPGAVQRSPWPWVVGCLGLSVLAPLFLATVGFVFFRRASARQQHAAQEARMEAEAARAELERRMEELRDAQLPPLGLSPLDASLAHSPFCAEVDAARAISARHARMAELVALAERPELAEHEQAHVAAALLEGGFFDENADGLVALLEHQDVPLPVLVWLRLEIAKESRSANKDRVLQALARETAERR